ncbi:DUF6477 family protein [Methylocystis sp. JAN1]|uniref:DUF6477 family protein n=1 Tax=Methylocystis sp. JAN1 TaxID=3397211 RepID=UPI003FA20D9E
MSVISKAFSSSDAQARTRALARLKSAARPALNAALDASLAGYDRLDALSRFHRLSRETILSETPEAARLVLCEIERALRAERARGGRWTYDLNRHIALLVAHRAEKARLARLVKPDARGLFSAPPPLA